MQPLHHGGLSGDNLQRTDSDFSGLTRAPAFRLVIAGCTGLLVLACSRAGDVESLGDGLYSTSARGYHAEAGDRVIEAARTHCERNGLRVLADDVQSREMEPGFYQATLTFRCVDATHPDLPRVD
jgi:hypothetical protein